MLPYIIAEVGSNWLTLQDCLDSITQAKLAEADAVKFQLYDVLSLYGWLNNTGFNYEEVSDTDFSKWGEDKSRHPSGVSALRGELDPEWLPHIKKQCDLHSIDFMCSAFSPELIDVVDPFVKTHKVASAEMCHVRMLEKLRDIGKPVILSTGAQTVSDIRQAVRILGLTPVTLMYCVSSYPAGEVDLGVIDRLKSEFNLPVGYSDHTLDVLEIPYHAWKTHGATVIEKHFTAIEASTPDSGHSLNPDQFKKMVHKIRGTYESVIGPARSEQDMIFRHKRRIIATRDIKAGEVVLEGFNIGIFRSLSKDEKALSPFMINRVNGSVAKNNIKAGDGVGPGDI